VEVRFLDIGADSVREPLTRRTDELLEHLLAGRSRFGRQVADWLGPHLDWADTVFIDWCVSTAALFTLLDPGGTRVIVRIHSFELFSHWPHVVDFARVDDVVVVSEHMRDLARAVAPQLRAEIGPRLHVIPNAADLGRFVRPKTAQARFTLGLVGVGSVVKDPRWTLDVLRLLRQHDPRYRLFMIGNGLDPATSAPVREYDALLRLDLDELEAAGAGAGAVRRIGHTDDVAVALTDIGVIVSSSVRESFHVALVEGAASGAVPVVRDWPFFAGRATGASTLFPREWVVTTPAEAAQRILDATATESDWLVAGKGATDHAMATWDWGVTRHHFDRLLLGRALADTAE
jgi:glycosyltransferase involved in cell wall biosynthesis